MILNITIRNDVELRDLATWSNAALRMDRRKPLRSKDLTLYARNVAKSRIDSVFMAYNELMTSRSTQLT
jgi:hypothetical protein